MIQMSEVYSCNLCGCDIVDDCDIRIINNGEMICEDCYQLHYNNDSDD